jgi:hypothetical protein
MVACYLFFFVISFVLAGLFISRYLLWGSGRSNVSSTRWFLASYFTFFSLIVEARSTLLRRILIDTRPPTAFPAVLHPCRRKLRSCRSLMIGTWCPRAWQLSAPWRAWGPRFVFFRPCTVATGSTASDLHLCGSGDDACPTRDTRHCLVSLASFSTASSLFLGVSAFLCLCYILFCFSPVTAYLCLDQILWEYLLANC